MCKISSWMFCWSPEISNCLMFWHAKGLFLYKMSLFHTFLGSPWWMKIVYICKISSWIYCRSPEVSTCLTLRLAKYLFKQWNGLEWLFNTYLRSAGWMKTVNTVNMHSKKVAVTFKYCIVSPSCLGRQGTVKVKTTILVAKSLVLMIWFGVRSWSWCDLVITSLKHRTTNVIPHMIPVVT